MADDIPHWIRPVRSGSKPIDVALKLTIQSIIEIEEKIKELKFYGYMVMQWYDEYRVWKDVFPYNCTRSISVIPGEQSGIWLPDVAFLSGENHYGFTRSNDIVVRIQKDGRSQSSPGGIVRANCDFIMTLFPFDTQTCVLKVESWKLPSDQETFSKHAAGFELRGFTEPEQWSVTGMEVEYTNTSIYISSFAKVKFQLKFQSQKWFCFPTLGLFLFDYQAKVGLLCVECHNSMYFDFFPTDRNIFNARIVRNSFGTIVHLYFGLCSVSKCHFK